jgi:hypothetical protein
VKNNRRSLVEGHEESYQKERKRGREQ